MDIITPYTKENNYHAFHLYVIQTQKRKELYEYLRKNKVFAQVHYIPLYKAPYYKQFGYNEEDYPHSEKYYQQCLSLPMFPSLTSEEQSRVIKLIKEFFS